MRSLFAICICLVCASIAPGQTTSPPLISVTGTAEIKVAPDEVVLYASIESRHEKLLDAKRENDGFAAKAVAFLKGKGIKDEDIQTSHITLTPEYDREKGPTKPVYYEASKSIEVIIRQVDTFEAIMTGLLENGVNSISGITFRNSKYRELRVKARAMAVKIAKEKADALAAELDVKRGKIYQVEAIDDGGALYGGYRSLNTALQGSINGNVGGADGEAGDSGGFSVGQISITSRVQASFLIE